MSRDVRLLMVGHVISVTGSQVSAVAIPLQAYEQTRSSLVVGLLGAAQLVPTVVVGVLGGSIVDAYDRRRVLLASQAMLTATGAGLVANALTPEPSLGMLFVLSAVIGAASSLNAAARIAVVPRLVEGPQLVPTLALVQTVVQLGRIAGPALAGILIATSGYTTAYAVDAVGFALALVATALMAPIPPIGDGDARRGARATLAATIEGLRFVQHEPILRAAFLADILAMFLALPRAAFPELGLTVMGGSAATVGLLHAAPGVGALIGLVGSGWTARVRYAGRAVLASVALWGTCVALLGVTTLVLGMRALPLALALLAVAGAADTISALFRSAILQWITPDRLRGRMGGLHVAVSAGSPRLGDAQVGVTASLIGAPLAVTLGGAACLAAVGVLAWWLPQLRDWQVPVAQPVA